MEINIVIYYSSDAGFMTAKQEIHNILTKLGDQKEETELVVPGVIGLKTKLDARKVIDELNELYVNDPNSVTATVKWIPVDYWCNADNKSILDVFKDEFKTMFSETDHYNIEITNEKPGLLDTLKPWIKGTINKEKPQKILKIELFGENAYISLLRPHNIFSKNNATF